MSSVTVAKSYLGTHTGQPAVGKFLAYVGLKPVNAWCLAMALFCAHTAHPGNTYPRMARCSMFWHRVTRQTFSFETHTPDDVSWGVYTPQAEDIAIFSHGGSVTNWSGHAATVENYLGKGRFRTVEGNTSANATGDQRMGGVVAEKTRYAGIRGFLLQGFVRPRVKS